MSKMYDGDEKMSTPSTLGRIRVNEHIIRLWPRIIKYFAVYGSLRE